jgi:hypothetical protein
MTQEFHLRIITQRASGGDPIIRERSIPGPEATIGRAADSDVVLADLAVDLKHARMRFSRPGRVLLESVGGLPFSVGGQVTQRAELDASQRPVAYFSSYALAFEPAEEGGVVVTVTRDEAERHESPSVFSLQSKVFGRRNMAWVFGAGLLLACLIVPLFLAGVLSHLKIHPDQQWSSGPLSRAHAFLENDCKACHANAFVAVRDAQCLACHAAGPDGGAASAQLARARDLGSPFRPLPVAEHAPHAKLEAASTLPRGLGAKATVLVQRAFNHPTNRCASCHIEHTKPREAGADPHAPATDKPDLVIAQSCESCHSGLKKRLPKTELIDTPSWSRHPAFRAQIITAAGPKPQFERIALKSSPQERNGLTFPHALHLDPMGGVARQAIDLGKARGYGAPLDCSNCHHAEAGGKGFAPIEMERDCSACHSLAYARGPDGRLKFLPHGELQKVVDTLAGRTLAAASAPARQRPGEIRPSAFSATGASAYRAVFSPGGACYDCHTVSWSGDTVRMAPVKLADRYLPSGGFDHSIPEHGGPGKAKAGAFECADCHKAATSTSSSDVLIPDLPKCAACHGKTTREVAAAGKADCVECHGFHDPGEAPPPPGHPPLETLRWTREAALPAGAS